MNKPVFMIAVLLGAGLSSESVFEEEGTASSQCPINTVGQIWDLHLRFQQSGFELGRRHSKLARATS